MSIAFSVNTVRYSSQHPITADCLNFDNVFVEKDTIVLAYTKEKQTGDVFLVINDSPNTIQCVFPKFCKSLFAMLYIPNYSSTNFTNYPITITTIPFFSPNHDGSREGIYTQYNEVKTSNKYLFKSTNYAFLPFNIKNDYVRQDCTRSFTIRRLPGNNFAMVNYACNAVHISFPFLFDAVFTYFNQNVNISYDVWIPSVSMNPLKKITCEAITGKRSRVVQYDTVPLLFPANPVVYLENESTRAMFEYPTHTEINVSLFPGFYNKIDRIAFTNAALYIYDDTGEMLMFSDVANVIDLNFFDQMNWSTKITRIIIRKYIGLKFNPMIAIEEEKRLLA